MTDAKEIAAKRARPTGGNETAPKIQIFCRKPATHAVSFTFKIFRKISTFDIVHSARPRTAHAEEKIKVGMNSDSTQKVLEHLSKLNVRSP